MTFWQPTNNSAHCVFCNFILRTFIESSLNLLHIYTYRDREFVEQGDYFQLLIDGTVFSEKHSNKRAIAPNETYMK